LEQIPVGPVSGIIFREVEMADDKTKTSKPDQDRVSGADHYEIRDFAHRFDLSLGEVRDLIRRHGNDRKTLEREARKQSGAAK
jgi:hypothetical protein